MANYRWAKGVLATMNLVEKLRDKSASFVSKSGEAYRAQKEKMVFASFLQEAEDELKERKFKNGVMSAVGERTDEAVSLFADLNTTFVDQFNRSNALIEKGQALKETVAINEELKADFATVMNQLIEMNSDAYDGHKQMKKLYTAIKSVQNERT